METNTGQPAVLLEDVTVSRRLSRSKRIDVLAGVSISASAGETVAIVGPSGCGKSTLLEVACGLLEPDGGKVASLPTALMPQRDLLLPWAGALDNAAISLRAAGLAKNEARERARELFVDLGLAGFEDTHPAMLSGGMRQRVAFVRTLLSGRPVIALDEPFASLDALTRIDARAWLADALMRGGRTALLVTHDVEEAVLLSDRVVVLSNRPATVVHTVTVDLPGPRLRRDPLVVQLREGLLELLGAGQ